MDCPDCHSNTRVIRTIKEGDSVLRVRVCINCHFSFTTREKIVEK
jgi:transcriptional regulator NrdR family protein